MDLASFAIFLRSMFFLEGILVGGGNWRNGCNIAAIVPKLPMFELLKFEHSYKLPKFKIPKPLFERAVPKFASNSKLPPYSA